MAYARFGFGVKLNGLAGSSDSKVDTLIELDVGRILGRSILIL
jgi:hypothetical protein